MAVQTPPGLMPTGGYWELPEPEKAAFRRKLRDLWNLPTNRTPTEKQMLFMLATYNRDMKTPIFFGGAMAGGKSTGLCMLAIHLAREIPNNRVLMCRKEFKAFRGSTLQELEEQLEAVPEAKHWPGKYEIHFPNKSEIWYMGVGSPQQREKLGSYQFGAILIDEAPELEHEIFNMLQTRLRWRPAADAKRLVLALTGNPYPGWIKQQFVKQPKKGYTFIPAKARDNPFNYAGYVADMKSEMPEEWYLSFIEGDWDAMTPTTSAIPHRLIERARARTEQPSETHCVLGIDVGHLGTDKTVIARRRGYKFDVLDEWGQQRTDETVDRVLHLLSYTAPYPHRIVVDYDGIGAGVGDGLLRAQEAGIIPETCEIVGLHAQKTATVEVPGFASVRYANMKSQLAFELRKILEGGRGDLPRDDEDLEQDLASANYDVIDGRVYIESKKLVRRKLGRSPDRGDAILLTMYAGSRDEIAGLPEQIATPPPSSDIIDAEEVERIELMQRQVAFYRNPFARLGVRKLHNDDGYSSDLGY